MQSRKARTIMANAIALVLSIGVGVHLSMSNNVVSDYCVGCKVGSSGSLHPATVSGSTPHAAVCSRLDAAVPVLPLSVTGEPRYMRWGDVGAPCVRVTAMARGAGGLAVVGRDAHAVLERERVAHDCRYTRRACGAGSEGRVVHGRLQRYTGCSVGGGNGAGPGSGSYKLAAGAGCRRQREL